MRLDQSSIDISTLVEKIRRREIDLQPNFQRGQVWPEAKKRRLIDTILRQWYVPAIHLVVLDAKDKEEVLDGQQRLRAIMAFMDDEFPVDGTIQPVDPKIRELNGLRYSQLSKTVQSQFKRFTLRTVRLRDYEPDEPGELFFRLNQLTALTAAEQRNALIGKPRNQIRRLASQLERNLGRDSIGFSNARMNYDDTLSRLATTLENGGLTAKLTSTTLERRYRAGTAFHRDTIESIEEAIANLSQAFQADKLSVRLNKASLFSWLFFLTDHPWILDPYGNSFFCAFFRSLEAVRASTAPNYETSPRSSLLLRRIIEDKACREAIEIFNDRSSSRVNDTASVILRDLSLNICCFRVAPKRISSHEPFSTRESALSQLAARLKRLPWDVAERSVSEADLAKRWEFARANG